MILINHIQLAFLKKRYHGFCLSRYNECVR